MSNRTLTTWFTISGITLALLLLIPLFIWKEDRINDAKALCEANGGFLITSNRIIRVEGTSNTYKYPCIDRNVMIKY